MRIAKDTVARIHYRLADADGSEIERSGESAPLAYLHGHGNLLPALEAELEGREAGERFSATLRAEQAYGGREESALQRIPLKQLVYEGRLQPGMVVGVRSADGVRQVTVRKIGKFVADVDANHPLAGRSLRFEIEVLDVRAASEQEIAHGHAHGDGGHDH